MPMTTIDVPELWSDRWCFSCHGLRRFAQDETQAWRCGCGKVASADVTGCLEDAVHGRQRNAGARLDRQATRLVPKATPASHWTARRTVVPPRVSQTHRRLDRLAHRPHDLTPRLRKKP